MSDNYAGLPEAPSVHVRNTLLAAAARANVPLMFYGPPGVGKTQTLIDTMESWGYKVIVVTGANRESTDFNGIPAIRDDQMVSLAPSWVKALNEAADTPRRDGRGKYIGAVLVLDEINRSMEPTMNAMLRVIQERWVGDEKLGPTVSILSIGNFTEDSPGTADLPDALANRMAHSVWAFDRGSFIDGLAYGFENLRPEGMSEVLPQRTDADRASDNAAFSAWVGSSLATNSHDESAALQFDNFTDDPVRAGRAWCSPRSLHNALKMCREIGLTDPTKRTEIRYIMESLVGPKPAQDLMTFLSKKRFVDPRKALNDPSSVNFVKLPEDIVHTLASAVVSIVVSTNQSAPASAGDTFDAAQQLMVNAAKANKADVVMSAATLLLNNMPAGAKISPAMRKGFQDLLQATGQLSAAPTKTRRAAPAPSTGGDEF